MYSERTPIEIVNVSGRTVFVKRDDMFAYAPAPPVAKLRGLRVILANRRREGRRLIGCFEASASRIGHGLAAACTEYDDLSCIVAYPQIRSRQPSASINEARRLGACLLPVPSNIVAICYRQAARQIEEQGGWMIPFGFDCPEAVDAVAEEAAKTPIELVRGGTVIVPCGSGVTLAGIARGLPAQPARMIGVSVGRSTSNILRCLTKHLTSLPNGLEIRPPTHKYSIPSRSDCPFPCDARYDLKAWEITVREISTLPDPVLFWNIGG